MSSTHASDILSSIDPTLYEDNSQSSQFLPSRNSPILVESTESSQNDPFDLDPPTPSLPTSIPTSVPTSPLNIEGSDVPTNSTALAARRRWAWVWKHMPDEDPQTVYLTKKGKVEWRCNYCKIRYLETGGTRIISAHLRSMHQITDTSAREERSQRVQATIEQALANARKTVSFKRRRMIDEEEDFSHLPESYIIDPQTLEILMVRLFIRCSLPLNLFECDEFRTLLVYLNKQSNIWVPSSHHTVSGWITRNFDENKLKMKQEMHSSRSKIHIICDAWTSPNGHSVFGAKTQFINETGKLRTITLMLREIEGHHTGENLAKLLYDEIDEWGIASKLGCLVMDNASNNDTLCIHLSNYSLDLIDKNDIEWNAVQNRIRCNAHNINLSAKAFLFEGSTPEDQAFDPDCNLEALAYGTDLISKLDYEYWKKRGVIGKCHNFTFKISNSPRLLQQWDRLAGKRLAKDNSTRWNSIDNLLSIFLVPQVYHAYKKWWIRYPNELPTELELTNDDFDQLRDIHHFLGALKDATEFTEGDNATLERVLPTMEFLLQHFENGKITYASNPFLGPCINNGWAKLEKYYSLTDRSPYYIAAVVLNPVQKWSYFEESWKESHPLWIERWKNNIERFWKDQYKPDFEDSSQSTLEETSSNTLIAHLQAKKASRHAMDEYAKYLATPPLECVQDPRKWWLDSTQQQAYPNLSKMALDLLSIPSTSAPVERLFSSAKITITARRNKLQIATVERIECLKSWLDLDSWMEDDIEFENLSG